MTLLFPRRLIARTIRCYQKTVSFDHGPSRIFYPYGFCRFYPTCSEYGRQAVDRYGVRRGTLLALKRLLRCHPWSGGGVDEVPQKQTPHANGEGCSR